jgi:hypothetical protein
MDTLLIFAPILLAGGIGGLLNAYLSEGGFRPPGQVDSGNGTILKPGWLGNVGVGALTASFSWSFYGPFAGNVVVGPKPGTQGDITLTLGAIAMAFLVGVGGARLLSSYVDKELFKATAIMVASGLNRDDVAGRIAISRPEEALDAARKLNS